MSEPEATNTAPPPPDAVQEEMDLLERVQRVIRTTPMRRRHEDYGDAFVRLRDSLSVERLPEDRASILEQMERIAHLAAQRARYKEERPDIRSPYFGHMRLRDEDGRLRDILIGKRTFIHDGVTIVDWRNAPISRVFYQSAEGDDYELSIDGRTIAGEVILRRTVTIRDGQVLRIGSSAGSWVRVERNWLHTAAHQHALRGGEGTAVRPDTDIARPSRKGGVRALRADRRERVDKHLPEIASLLDPEQFRLITSADSGLIAVYGSAGSGKTTVALHRVAYLAYLDPVRFNPRRTLVVVFSRALARYISRVLPGLGVEGVKVTTYDEWAHRLRVRHFSGLPKVYSDDTPAIVTRFKHHSALLPMLAEAAREHRGRRPAALFDELFTNRDWLRSGVDRHAPAAFSEDEITEVHRWCTRQHFNRVDGGGVGEHELPCLDREDDTLLLRLSQLLRGPLRDTRKRPLRYAHLVVDEAQDLSPIELMVLLQTVRHGNPVTLAGDRAQKVVSESDFQSWEQVLDLLGLEHAQMSPLKISYRSTAQVMDLAIEVLGPLALEDRPVATRQGAPVELLRFESRGEAVTFLSDALWGLVEAEPSANVALLARHPAYAEEIYRALRRSELPTLRRVRDQDFSFAPGIEVTDIEQAKGLEFDYVVIVDCDAGTYPPNPASRHILHVGITRTAHQCWLISVGEPTPLVPSRYEAGRSADSGDDGAGDATSGEAAV